MKTTAHLSPLATRRLRITSLASALLAVVGLTSGDALAEPTSARAAADHAAPVARSVHVDGPSIRLDESVQFSFASAAIGEEMSTHLLNLALFLSAHPEYRRVLVLGHADDTGPDGFNMRVSRARAHAVVERLVAAGIEPGRLIVAALGELRPVAQGTSDRARRANRRVELTIVDRASSSR